MGTAVEGCIAIVTGASRGIGKTIAQRLAAEGAYVAVTARTLAAASNHPLGGSLEETVALISDAGGEAVAIQADLSDPSYDRAEIVARTEEAFGGSVDILVNNAAACFHLPFDATPEKRLRITLEMNVVTPWLLALAVLPGMKATGRGWILNISSGAAATPVGPPFAGNVTGGTPSYGGSKAMLDRVTVGAAQDLYDAGIAVNALAPETGVASEGAAALIDIPDTFEPHETMAEAALALVTGDPSTMTGRVAYSLSLLHELQRPVYDLGGRALVEGWQPGQFPTELLRAPYLARGY